MLHSTVKPFAQSMTAHLLVQTEVTAHLKTRFLALVSMILLVHSDAHVTRRFTAGTTVTKAPNIYSQMVADHGTQSSGEDSSCDEEK
jgi:hypothetical protein